MVRRSSERKIETKKMFGGEGEVVLQHILNGAEEMYGKGRVFAHTVLAPGCEIGWHIHHGDGETYYILKGTGLYNNNGEEVTVGPGDITFVDDGEGHSLKNIGEDKLETIALILYKKKPWPKPRPLWNPKGPRSGFRLARRKAIEFVFSEDMCLGKNSSHGANVRAARVR